MFSSLSASVNFSSRCRTCVRTVRHVNVFLFSTKCQPENLSYFFFSYKVDCSIVYSLIGIESFESRQCIFRRFVVRDVWHRLSTCKMAWFGDGLSSLSNLKGQITNFTKEVLSEGIVEEIGEHFFLSANNRSHLKKKSPENKRLCFNRRLTTVKTSLYFTCARRTLTQHYRAGNEIFFKFHNDDVISLSTRRWM